MIPIYFYLLFIKVMTYIKCWFFLPLLSLKWLKISILWASLVAQIVKNLPAIQETRVWSLGQEDPLAKGMATHSSVLNWRITWTVEPGRLRTAYEATRVGHNWITKHSHMQVYYNKALVIKLEAKVKFISKCSLFLKCHKTLLNGNSV